MKWFPTLAVAILLALLVRQVFPRTVDRVVPGPPTKPDTVLVTQTDLDTIYVPQAVQTDTFNIVHTVYQTDTITIAALPARWYLDGIKIGQALGDTTTVRAIWMKGTEAGLRRAEEVTQYWTPGPLEAISTSNGVQLQFGQYSEPPSACNVGCRLLWGLGGLSIGYLTGQLTP